MAFKIGDLLAFLQSVKGGISGIADKVFPAEELFITLAKAPLVLCWHCGENIGYVKDTESPAGLGNMAPLTGNKRPEWTCPECGKDIRAWLPQGAVIKTTKGVFPC